MHQTTSPISSGEPPVDEPAPPTLPRGRTAAALWVMVAISTAALFGVACLRHYTFRSGAMDLGFFDQAVYLISAGQYPAPQFVYYGFHILGDHAAFVLYPIALLYKIHPSPLWLLFIQAASLSLGCLPIYKLARLEGLSNRQAVAIGLAYLLYPFVLAANLFDFHPDTVALPLFIAAVYFARARKPAGFAIALLLTLACKELLAPFVAAMGVWLLLLGRRRAYGAFAIVCGITWFFIATKLVIPAAGAPRIAGADYFADYGTSMGQVAMNLFLKPQITLRIVASLSTVKYLAIVFLPLLWGMHYKHLGPLLAAVPVIGMNVIASNPSMRNPFMYYTLPAVPFLFYCVILAVSSNRAWLTSPRSIATWTCGLLVIATGSRLWHVQFNFATAPGRDANTEALSIVAQDGQPLLTTFENAPHAAHRSVVQYINTDPAKQIVHFATPQDPRYFHWVLINTNQETIARAPETANRLLNRLGADENFRERIHRDGVFLFEQTRQAEEFRRDPDATVPNVGNAQTRR